MQKISFPTLVCMEHCLEIIYKFRNAPAAGVNIIQAPNLELPRAILRADSGNGCTRIP
jgi:hypothetical protein